MLPAMTDPAPLYREKLRAAADFVRSIPPRSFLVFGTWSGQPHGLLRALADYREELFANITILTAAGDFILRPGFRGVSGFFGPYERAARARFDNIAYCPVQYLDAARGLQCAAPLDYIIHRVTPMDERGFFNFSLCSSWEYPSIRWLRRHRPDVKIVLEANPHLPRVRGLAAFGANEIHVSDVDVVLEDESPLQQFPPGAASDIERRIAGNVAALVEDRATLQLGFGTLPGVIGSLLASRRELGIHTEMLCDANVDLIEAGAVTNAHKGLYDGISVATFAIGTERLWNWARDNPAVAMLPVEETNSPAVLARVRNLVSINSALTVDLTGQTCAHCLGPVTYSGLGGALEFTYGAQLSPGGKSIICLPSTATLKDGRMVSNIVAAHPPGTRITIPEHTVDWIATEYGAARLKFLFLEQRAQALIELAHPDFRAALRQQAEQSGLRLSRVFAYPDPPETFFVRPAAGAAGAERREVQDE
jgi:4-hydroxybutyrate CoA-transferase